MSLQNIKDEETIWYPKKPNSNFNFAYKWLHIYALFELNKLCEKFKYALVNVKMKMLVQKFMFVPFEGIFLCIWVQFSQVI
jgi:hypothetical protein